MQGPSHALESCSTWVQVLDGVVGELEAASGTLSAAELYKRVLRLSGMGPFTSSNILQLLGMLPVPCVCLISIISLEMWEVY